MSLVLLVVSLAGGFVAEGLGLLLAAVMALNLLMVLGETELALIKSLFRSLTALLMLLPEVVVAG